MIKILDRGYISITPESLFWKEANKELQEPLLEIKNPEATIYLIEEDFWDNESILKKYYKGILEAEMRQVDTTGTLKLKELSIENIHDYFNIEFGNLVVDLEQKPIQITKDDLSN